MPVVGGLPEWRATAVYDRDELIKMISSEALPPDRRMVYALMGLAGLRHGEMAGLHWRNYDATREPLGKLVIARSYDHATTKSKRPREVPVHPTLAQLLGTWRAKGCTEILGRAPEQDDLLIPSREGEMRSRHHTLNKLLEDLERLNLRSRRGHDLRRTFITLARADGARADLLEMITHAPRGDIINIYTSMPWANLCAEVAKLQIALPQSAEVIPLRRAVNDGSSAMVDVLAPNDRAAFTSRLTSVPSLVAKTWNSLGNSEWKLVEAPGVEPGRPGKWQVGAVTAVSV
jgi:hypothetical protein